MGRGQPAQSSIEVSGRVIYFDEKITETVRQNLLTDVNSLISKNSSDFDGINLEKLKIDTQSIVVAVADGAPFTGSGYRNGAINFTEKSLFIYNFSKLRNYGQNQKVLLQWHEAFGAMGYNDDNYLLSISFVQKISTPEKSLHPHIRERLKSQINEPRRERNKEWRLADGGVSGVGSGGDGDMAEIKWALLSYIELLANSNRWGNSDKIKKMIDITINTPVESLNFKSNYQNLIPFEKFIIGLNLFNAKVCFLVNPKNWQSIDQTKGVVSEQNTEILQQMVLALELILNSGIKF